MLEDEVRHCGEPALELDITVRKVPLKNPVILQKGGKYIWRGKEL